MEIVPAEVPQTLEGYYMLHDVYAIDWPAWCELDKTLRISIANEAADAIDRAHNAEHGDSAVYSVITQKGDLMFVHYRSTPDELNDAELELRRSGLYAFLEPRSSYLSVIEVSLYELTAIAHQKLAKQNLRPGQPGFDEAFEIEMDGQRQRVRSRLIRRIPDERYICFYPMSKRRGEADNWYALPLEDRRELMRGHGRIGHKYHDQITQIIGGSTGLDDWEWSVSLHADDILPFKKLVYEMRFDAASARYADFGPFTIAIRMGRDAFMRLLGSG